MIYNGDFDTRGALYTPMKEKHGVAYYYIEEGGNGVFVKNENHKNNVEIKKLNANETTQPIDIKGTLYEAFLKNQNYP